MDLHIRPYFARVDTRAAGSIDLWRLETINE